MSPMWGDVVARARGLSTHLLTRDDLGALAEANDLAALSAQLVARGYLIAEEQRGSADAVELAVRRQAAREMRLVERWCDERRTLIAVVFEDEDRRSLRALLRGAMQQAKPESRLAGLVPTPALPERALQELAGLATPRLIAATLAVWSNPYAVALETEVTGQEPDLLRLERAINRVWAARALEHARGLLRTYVRNVIDIENAYTALACAAEPDRPAASALFLSDGARLTRSAFDAALEARPERTADVLADALAPGRVSAGFRAGALDAEGPERAVLAAMILDLRDASRLDPVSPAPVLRYALQLRAQALDLRRIVWGLSLGAPGALLREGLVTA